MDEHSALLATILENPADDTVRLVLADLLRESDDPDSQAWGRFMWGAVTTTRYTTTGAIADEVFRTALKEVNSVIEDGYPARWLSKLGIGPRPLIRQDWQMKRKRDRYTIVIGAYEGVFTRGMLSELSISLGEWYELGEAALAQLPLTFIEIIDVPGLGFHITKTDDGWEVACGFQLLERGILETDTDPDWWQIRECYADRESLVSWIVKDSYELVTELNDRIEER